MMDSTGTQAHLGHFKSATFAEQQIVFWHTHVVESNVHMTPWRMVVSEHFHRFKYFNPRGIGWH